MWAALICSAWDACFFYVGERRNENSTKAIGVRRIGVATGELLTYINAQVVSF
jgi:hypothetical protein